MLMSQLRDELDELLSNGVPDSEIVLTVPTDKGHSAFIARRISLEPPEDMKVKDIRASTCLRDKQSILYVKG